MPPKIKLHHGSGGGTASPTKVEGQSPFEGQSDSSGESSPKQAKQWPEAGTCLSKLSIESQPAGSAADADEDLDLGFHYPG